jgi:hypothetical protein
LITEGCRPNQIYIYISLPGIGIQVLIATENDKKPTSSIEGHELAIG